MHFDKPAILVGDESRRRENTFGELRGGQRDDIYLHLGPRLEERLAIPPLGILTGFVSRRKTIALPTCLSFVGRARSFPFSKSQAKSRACLRSRIRSIELAFLVIRARNSAPIRLEALQRASDESREGIRGTIARQIDFILDCHGKDEPRAARLTARPLPAAIPCEAEESERKRPREGITSLFSGGGREGEGKEQARRASRN